MNVKEVLSELGLSEGEIKVYLALLKLGSVPVSKIKEETGLHRTTIYDFVEKLLNKALVNYVVKSNVNYYKATHPSKLIDYVKEKQDHIEQVMPELERLSNYKPDDVEVEVYKGREGLKTAMLIAIREKKDVMGIGVDEALFKRELPAFVEQYQRMLKENNIHERILTKTNPEYLFDSSNDHYKHLPPSMFSPLSIAIFGDKVLSVLWEPTVTSVLVKNKQHAEAYKKHFESMWNQESIIYKGDDEIKLMFDSIVEESLPKEEWLVFGSPPLPKKWVEYFEPAIKKLDEKKVITKIIYDEESKDMIRISKNTKYTKCKILSKEHMSPAEVNIYGSKVMIVLWDEAKPQGILINNEKIAYSFKKYFELMWKIAE